MRKIIYWVHTSVDGYIAGPNGEFGWPAVGPELFAYSEAMNEQVDTLLYGRVVWEWMSAYWPTADADPRHHRRPRADVCALLAADAEGRDLPHAGQGRLGRPRDRREPRRRGRGVEAAAGQGHLANRFPTQGTAAT